MNSQVWEAKKGSTWQFSGGASRNIIFLISSYNWTFRVFGPLNVYFVVHEKIKFRLPTSL